MSFEDFVHDPALIKVTMGDLILTISPTTDVIHHWSFNDVSMLKYWDEEDGTMKNVCLNEGGYETLKKFGIPVAERDIMSTSEFDHWVGVVAMAGIDHLDFKEDQRSIPGWDSEGNYLTGWIKE